MTAAATMEAPAAPAPALELVEGAGTEITEFDKIEAGLAELRTKYADAVFDCRDAKGFAQAWDDAHAEDARRTQEASERAAAAKRREERVQLERDADPWPTVVSLVAKVERTDVSDADFRADARMQLVELFAARAKLEGIESAEAALVDATEGRR